MSLGERPDEDVAKPELPIKVPKTNLKNNCEARECVQKTFRHLIVLPASHEVLVRFNVIPHLLRGDHLEMAHLEHHPAAPLRFQVAIHLPGSLRLEEKFFKCDFWASSVSSRTHQVGWVNEVDTRFGSTLSCLDVVARCADMVSPREVISLSCLLSGWRVQGMLRAGRISPVEISKKSIRSVGLRKKQVVNFFL